MGSGLLYGGIGVLWIVVLSRTWLNRRLTARADRAAPPSSRQRILNPDARSSRSRRGARRGGSDRVVAVQEAPGGRGWPVSRAARRRRRVLLLLLLASAALAAGFVLHRLPSWAPGIGLAAATVWFALGMFAARAGRRARRGYRRRVARRERTSRERAAAVAAAASVAGRVSPAAADRIGPLDEPSWGSVPSVGVVARWGREDSDTDGLDRRVVRRVAAPMQPAVAVEVAPGSWQPVPVPLPTYVTAPLAPRTVASIEFGHSGSWTSEASPAGGRTAQIILGSGRRDGQPPAELQGRHAAEADPRPAGDVDELTAELDFELPEAVGN